jgi:hypothetical protein
MAAPITLDELEQSLYDLAVKVSELKVLELAIDSWSPLAAAAAAVGTGPPFQAFYNGALDQVGGVISSGDYPDLGGIPDFCRNIISIDAEQFRGAAELLDGVAMDMVGLEGAPGNVLTKIGNWYGDAAEAFEEYFSGYGPAQARQAELFAATINACASMDAIVTASQESVASLIEGACNLADELIKVYWETQEAMQTTMTLAVIGVVAAGLSAGAAAGALAVLGAVGGGASALAGGMYSFQASEKQLTAQNLDTLLESLSENFTQVETAIRDADDEIAENIDSLRHQWSMSGIAIPAPPGADEVDTESFHHESSA